MAAHAIPPHALTQLARDWLREDTPNFDPAGVCVGSGDVEAHLLCKTAHSVLAGGPFFTAVFAELGCTVTWLYPEAAEIGERGVTVDRSVTQRRPLGFKSWLNEFRSRRGYWVSVFDSQLKKKPFPRGYLSASLSKAPYLLLNSNMHLNSLQVP